MISLSYKTIVYFYIDYRLQTVDSSQLKVRDARALINSRRNKRSRMMERDGMSSDEDAGSDASWEDASEDEEEDFDTWVNMT